MTKLEKVIKGLEHCTREVIDAFVDECSMCPYKPTNDDEKNCVDRTQRDALELLKEREAEERCLKTKCIICPHCDNCDVDENGLLKEQEAVKPKEVNMYPAGQYACGFCGHISVWSKDYHAKYCPECGKAVKWDE